MASEKENNIIYDNDNKTTLEKEKPTYQLIQLKSETGDTSQTYHSMVGDATQ